MGFFKKYIYLFLLVLWGASSYLNAAKENCLVVSLKYSQSIITVTSCRMIPGLANFPTRPNTDNQFAPNIRPYMGQLILKDSMDQTLFQLPFHFIYAKTIPPAQTKDSNRHQETGIIYLKDPEVSLIIPYFPNAVTMQLETNQHSTFFNLNSLQQTNNTVKNTENTLSRMPLAADRLHILFIASGYSAADMDKFRTRAAEIGDYMMSKEPFNHYQNKISIHIYANTADLECQPNCLGIPRLLCCTDAKVLAAAAASGLRYDEIIVIHNTTTYCGGGYRDLGSYKTNSYSSYCMIFAGSSPSDPQPKPMALHEFGHSFANLCDEYTYGAGDYDYPYYNCVNCRANCGDWSTISSGCIQSCDARSDYYRPDNSIMNTLSIEHFNDVSIYADYSPDGIAKRLAHFISADEGLPPLFFNGLKISTMTALIAEYAIRLSWQANPGNANTMAYRLYQMTGNSELLIAECDRNTFTYLIRRVNKDAVYDFSLVAVDNLGIESTPAYITVR